LVDLVVLQTASYLIAALSFAVTCGYYMLNLRNTRKTQELQVFMQVFDRFNNKEFWNELYEMMKRERETIEDYEKKYSGAGGNVVFPTLEGLGVLLKRGLIDASVSWDLFGNYIFQFWDKYVPIIRGRQKVIGSDYCIWTEYLVKEVKRYAVEHPESLEESKSK
jgi:hypothetical protein